MFSSLIKIRFSSSNLSSSPYKLPLGKYGVLFITVIGIASSSFAIFIGLYLSLRLTWGHHFILSIFFSVVLLCILLFAGIKYSKNIKMLVFEKSDHTNNKGRKIAFTLVGLGIAAYFVKYFLNIILTRHLTPSEYGDLAVFLRTVIILSLVLLLGTNNSTKKYLSKYLVKKDIKNIREFIIWNSRVVRKALLIYILSLFGLYVIMSILHLFDINLFTS